VGLPFLLDNASEEYVLSHTYQTVYEDKIEAVLFPKEQENNLNFNKLNYKEAIKAVQTPDQVQGDFFEKYFYFDQDEIKEHVIGPFVVSKRLKGESFKYNYNKKKGVCLDYATCAAALLSDNGYAPLLLSLRDNSSTEGHMVFLFKDKETGLFGALGSTPMFGDYFTVKDLVKDFEPKHGWKFDKYAIINLDDKFPNHEWIDGSVDMQRVTVDKWTEVNP